MLRLEVIDQGNGIPGALGIRAWKRHAHHATAFTGDRSGHGIGLAAVRQLVTRYGGHRGATRDAAGHRIRVDFPLEAA